MSQPRLSTKKKRSIWGRLRIIILSIIVVIIVASVILYNQSNSILTSLRRSLGTFALEGVTYPQIEPDEAKLNISCILRNPTDVSITIDSFYIEFSIKKDYVRYEIGDVGADNVGEILQAGESERFSFEHVTKDPVVINILMNESYTLLAEGEISGSTSFIFIQSHIQYFEKSLVISPINKN